MIIRACKRILRSLLREASITYAPNIISHFFNCLLGVKVNPNPQPTIPDVRPPNDACEYSYLSLTPDLLDGKIRDEVMLRFRYALAEGYVDSEIRVLPLLREICQRVGIQIAAQNYHFVKKSKKDLKKNKRTTTFIPEDITNLLPVVKHAAPKV